MRCANTVGMTVLGAVLLFFCVVAVALGYRWGIDVYQFIFAPVVMVVPSNSTINTLLPLSLLQFTIIGFCIDLLVAWKTVKRS